MTGRTPQRTRHRPLWRILALVGPLTVAACGGSDASGTFDATVAEVRAAVDRGDRDAAVAELDSLAVEALAAHEAGQLSDGELDEVARLIESSHRQLDALLPTTTSTTTTTTTTTVQSDDDDDDDHTKGKRKGHDDD